MGEWGRVTDKLNENANTDREGRAYTRVFFASASHEIRTVRAASRCPSNYGSTPV